MPPHRISAEDIARALRAVRHAESIHDSPLLELRVVRAQILADGLQDEPRARAALLARWLEHIVSGEVARLRGTVAGADSGARPTPEEHVRHLCTDFAAQDLEREAWGLLYVRFFSGSRVTLRQLCHHIGVAERTIRRRINRGYRSLAARIIDLEQEAYAGEAGALELPREMSPFIGRERERGQVRRLLQATRLVSVTGPGGIGKSRLALQLARDLGDAFPDGVRFADLSVLDDGSQVPETVLRAFGIEEPPARSATEALFEHIADRGQLLVLDNCEHVIEACVALLSAMLDACPAVQVLITSRAVLELDVESVFTLPPMTVPPEEEPVSLLRARHLDAVRLFASRAAAHVDDFTVEEATVGPIMAICRRLEGVPLALEIAAGRLTTSSLGQLQEELSDRFATLRAHREAARPVHGSLETALVWSYDLLDPAEQALLRRLTVFRADWGEAAAVRVCSGEGLSTEQVPPLLERLAAKSLISRVGEGEPFEEGARFRMLDVQREFALRRMGDAEIDHRRSRHLAEQLHLAERFESEVDGPQQATWLSRVKRAYPDLRFALGWACRTARFAEAARLGAALQQLWLMTGTHRDGLRLLRGLFSAAGEAMDTTAGAKALGCAAHLATALHELDEAERLQRRALAIRRAVGDRTGEHRSLHGLGGIASTRSDLVAAAEWYRQSVEIQREIGDRTFLAGTLHNLGVVALRQGRLDEARPLLEEAIDIWQAQDNHRLTSVAQLNLAMLERDAGCASVALAMARASRELADEIGDKVGVLYAANAIGNIAQDLDDLSEARRAHAEALRLGRELDIPNTVGPVLHNLAVIALLVGEIDEAERLNRQAETLAQKLDRRDSLVHTNLLFAMIAEAHGDLAWMRTCLREAHVHAAEGTLAPIVLLIVDGVGRLLMHLGRPASAARLLYGADACFDCRDLHRMRLDAQCRTEAEQRLADALDEAERARIRETVASIEMAALLAESRAALDRSADGVPIAEANGMPASLSPRRSKEP